MSILLDRFDQSKNITNLEAKLNNNFKIKFDKTYKVKDYYYKIHGKIINTFVYKEPIESDFLKKILIN